MCLFIPRFRIRNHVTLSNNNVQSSRPCYPPAVMAQTIPLPGAVGDSTQPQLVNWPIRPGMFNQNQSGVTPNPWADNAPILPPLDLGPQALSDLRQGETVSFVITFTSTGTNCHTFHSRHKDLIRALSITDQLFPPVSKLTIRKNSGLGGADEKAPLLDFEKSVDNQGLDSGYVTLDLRNGDISTNLDEKKFRDLKEKLDACKERATKLKEIQSSLDMTGEKGDTMSLEGEVGPQEMEDWKRLVESDEKRKIFEDTKRRLGEARNNFSASMDKLTEELTALKNAN